MYIKGFGTYTVREAHDRLRYSRKKRVQFYRLIGSIMEKDVSLMKSFEECYLKVFLKCEVYLQKVLKRIGLRKFEKNHL